MTDFERTLRQGALALAGILAIVAALVGRPEPAAALEVTESFDVTVEPASNGDIRITERISVRAEGKKIKRGIFRDLPLGNRESYQPSMPYRDIEVDWDGGPTLKASSETTESYYRIYLGDPQRFLKVPATYSYEISYTISRAILQFDDRDEVYVNAIPTRWDFPINRATVTVALPEGMEAKDLKIFSGSFGSKQNMLHATGDILESGRRVQVDSNGPIPARQGITIAVQLPADAVSRTYADPNLEASISKLAGVLIYAIICVIAWIFVGRDPAPETVFPQFEPPPGVSPAAARFVYNFGNVDSNHVMATGIVSAATKGAVRIDDNGKKIVCTGKNFDALSRGELKLLTTLFQTGDKEEDWKEGLGFALSGSRETANKLAEGWNAMLGPLEREFARSHFEKNTLLRGFLIVIACLIALFILLVWGPSGSGLSVPVDFGVIPTLFFLSFVGLRLWPIFARGFNLQRILNWNSLNSDALRRRQGLYVFAAGVAMAAALFFVGADIHLWISGFALLFLAGIHLAFDQLLQSRTVQGQGLVAHLQGLRMYLAAAEHNQFKDMEPEPTPEQFTKLYPYAYALKLNNVWVEKFAGQLAEWSKTGGTRLDWYFDSDRQPFSWRRFDRIERQMNISNTGASYGPASGIGKGQYSPPSFGGGGFGGGGSSGGGAGGGGGGGW